MTAPTMADDFLFDLDLRLVPVDEKTLMGTIQPPVYSLSSCYNTCHCATKAGATCHTCRRCI